MTNQTPSTRRHPRTVEEAFGPYHRTLDNQHPRYSMGNRIMMVVSVLAAVALLAVILFAPVVQP